MGLQFVDGLGRADRDNAIDVYMGDEYEDVLRDGEWQKRFKVKPEVFTAEEKKAWLAGNQNVTLGSDAFSHSQITLNVRRRVVLHTLLSRVDLSEMIL